MGSKYKITEGGLNLNQVLGADVGQVHQSGACASFDELPFAKDVGDWRLPDGSFSWLCNHRGVYWLTTSAGGRLPARNFVLQPVASGGETT